MNGKQSILLTALILGALGLFVSGQTRSFAIDFENDTFVMDGKPFRYISGSIHYFRMPHEYWRDRLRKMRAAGLNAISTYVEWSSHEPEPGQYNFEGDADLVQFIKIAQEEDLYVILRPGPYICAEREFGGFPYWLLTKYPNIKLRTNDTDYITEVNKWLDVLMPKMVPLLYGNGGPIITIQVENEYGSFGACDFDYLHQLTYKFRLYSQGKAVLFTTDGNGEGYLKCGKIEGVYATVDFGTGWNPEDAFKAQRQFEPNGPLVNSEFYSGWLTHWGEKMASVDKNSVASSLDALLKYGANVNMYMFHGGTNFQFTAGANYAPYVSDITSYDYDAPLSEAGDLTEKYEAVKQVIGKYVTLPNITVSNSPKGDLGKLVLPAVAGLFNPTVKSQLGTTYSDENLLTFEALKQNHGYLLYETQILDDEGQQELVADVRDYANVFINQQYVNNLDREHEKTSVTISTSGTPMLGILVENLGRINYGSGIHDPKGIYGDVTVNEKVLKNWLMTSFPLNNVSLIETCIINSASCVSLDLNSDGLIFYGTKFSITTDPVDIFLDVSNLKKGLVFVNNFNIGRYWSVRGPQKKLYVPGVYLKKTPEENTLIILEEELKQSEIVIGSTGNKITDWFSSFGHKSKLMASSSASKLSSWLGDIIN